MSGGTQQKWVSVGKQPNGAGCRPSTPGCYGLILSVLLLLGTAALLGHRAGSSSGRVKYIHVITTNTSCDGGLSSDGLTSSGSSSSSSSPSAAGAPQPGGTSVTLPDASLLQHVLPLTNFSALTSAAILDSAAGAKLPPSRLQPLMQAHQQLWCSSQKQQDLLPNMTTVKFSNVSLYVYSNNDIVSNELRGALHTWEGGEIKEMLWALRQYEPQQQLMPHLGARPAQQLLPPIGPAPASNATAAAPAKGLRRLAAQQQKQQQRPRPLMLDVGGNIGWFSLNAAAAGARVASFEAMDANLALLRRSLCANQWLAERISLFGTGLGEFTGHCQIISGLDNQGDGIAVCNKTYDQALKDMGWNSTVYQLRGQIGVRQLDELIQEDVQVMKIDVEGFELRVLRGAAGLLTRHNVWYIMLECNPTLIGGQRGQMEYLRFLDAAGYAISLYSFSGPFMDPATLKDDNLVIAAFNLYCVRKDLRAVQVAKQAGVTLPDKGGGGIGGIGG